MSDARDRKRSSGGVAGGRRGRLAASAESVLAKRTIGPADGAPFAVDFLSNAPWAATGYGQQVAQLAPRLKQAGHPVAIHCNYGLAGSVSSWQGIPLFPHGHDGYSNDTAIATFEHWAALNDDRKAVLLTLFDVWVFKNPRFADIPIASGVPVDLLPAPPEVLAWCRRPNVTPIAMSEFGQRMLTNNGGCDNVEYAPHGIDTAVYTPNQTSEDGSTGRDLLRLDDDTFLVGIVAANKGQLPNRKRFDVNLAAVSELIRRHDNVKLYMHTEPMGGAGGINLVELLAAVGIPEDRVIWPDQWAYHHGITPRTVASLYGAMDVLLACSAGEGFGIPVIEAQACGTPVVVSDWTAQPELVGDGWLVKGQPDWDPFQKAWFFTPFVHSAVDALEEAYQRGRGRSTAARTFAERYDADTVFDTHWRPILGRLAERLNQ